MNRAPLIAVALLLAVAAGLVVLLLQEPGTGAGTDHELGPDGRPRLNRTLTGGKHDGTGPEGTDAGTGARGAKAGAGAGHKGTDGDVVDPHDGPGDMPTTAKGFVDLLRDLAGKELESHEASELLEHVMEDFFNLLSTDPDQRRAAIELFRQEGNAQLLELMALVFGRVEAPEMKEGMLQIAQFDTNVPRREQALSALGFYESADVVPVALGVIRSETDPRLQAKAIEALPDLPPDGVSLAQRGEVSGQLARLADSPEQGVRVNAIRALGDWSDESYTPKLLAGLKDADMPVRATAAFALALRAERSPEAKQALLRLLQDTSEHIEVRGSAADTLRNFATNDPEIKSAVAAFVEWERANPPARSPEETPDGPPDEPR